MIKVGIVGATGYTGVELLRLLLLHPQAETIVVTSNSEQGKRVDEVFPGLRGQCTLTFDNHETEKLSNCDLVFFATPHATAMNYVPALLENDIRVIDLSADFRLKDSAQWQDWYKLEHSCPQLLDSAVYGLPELNRDSIKKARLVANPGCYPTAISLALLPALASGAISASNIIADAKSGVSGAGRSAALGTLHAEVSESFKAYSATGHRHWPEIVQTLKQAADETDVNVTFVPHLVPMNRGILATTYLQPLSDNDWQQMYESFYLNEPFVDVLPSGTHPETRSVRGTNICQLAVHQSSATKPHLIVISVIDNLVKGAAGQAIQNMNLMFGLEESSGLFASGLIP